MQFPSLCKNFTDRYVSANYPVSCSAVLGQQWKLLEFPGYLSPWYRVCTNARYILKGSYGCGEPKMQFPIQCKNRTDRYRPANYPVSFSTVLGQQWKFSEFRGYLSPWYHVCTNAMFILKPSYGCGEPKNSITQSVQKPHRQVPSCKLPRVMQRHIGPAIEIFGISGLPFSMVPCLHQCNVYIKRKLRVWRTQKCNFKVSAKTTPTGMVNKLPRVMKRRIGSAMEIFGISGLPIAMVPC